MLVFSAGPGETTEVLGRVPVSAGGLNTANILIKKTNKSQLFSNLERATPAECWLKLSAMSP